MKDKIKLKLAKKFVKLHYDIINMFKGGRSCIKPLHLKDFTRPDDHVYYVKPHGSIVVVDLNEFNQNEL